MSHGEPHYSEPLTVAEAPVVLDYAPPVFDYAPPVLDYAPFDATQKRSRSLRQLTVIAWACVAITPLAMSILFTEVIVGTGMLELLFGTLMGVYAIHQRARDALILSAFHLALVGSVFVWIFVFAIDPPHAHRPVLIVSCIATLAGAYPTWQIAIGRCQ